MGGILAHSCADGDDPGELMQEKQDESLQEQDLVRRKAIAQMEGRASERGQHRHRSTADRPEAGLCRDTVVGDEISSEMISQERRGREC